MRNVLNKICGENQNTHFMFIFLNLAFYGKIWKNIADLCTPQMTIWRMYITCWILKAKNTHSASVIIIVLPLQQWLKESTSMLRYTYVVCLVPTVVFIPDSRCYVKDIFSNIFCRNFKVLYDWKT